MIPSLGEVWAVLCLISPGYISLVLFYKFWRRKSSLDSFDKLLFSIVLSFIIFLFYYHLLVHVGAYSDGIDAIDPFVYSFLKLPNLVVLISLIFAVPFVLAILFGYTHFTPETASAWDDLLFLKSREKGGAAIIVHTTDGAEYKGFLLYTGIDKGKRDVSITKPVKIIRDKNDRVIVEYTVGSSLLFTENNISRISFVE
ncbi:MAG: DUF6338 family protein [Candidatus Micrarchaeota archaeon]|nr:DUF6338 family protein [Candidatus Micrarchaeota archaeon]